MTGIQSNVIPIGQDPSLAGLDFNNMMGRSGATPLYGSGVPITSNVAPIQGKSPSVQQSVTQPTAPSGVGNLERELATIQALRASAPSGGLGQTIGGGLGGAVGAIGGPVGAAVGSGVGGAIGSVVDYMINEKAQKRAEAKELKARRAQIMKEKLKANSAAIEANRNKAMGIRESIEQEQISNKQRLIQERQMMLDNLMFRIKNKADNNTFLQNKFLASRSI